MNFIHIKSMPSSIKVHSKPTWLISFFILFSLSSSDPRTSEAGLYCSPAKSTDKNFVPVFVKEMEFLSQLVTLNLWGSHFVNSTPPMYGLAQCHQDLSHLDCLLCYAAGRTKLPDASLPPLPVSTLMGASCATTTIAFSVNLWTQIMTP